MLFCIQGRHSMYVCFHFLKLFMNQLQHNNKSTIKFAPELDIIEALCPAWWSGTSHLILSITDKHRLHFCKYNNAVNRSKQEVSSNWWPSIQHWKNKLDYLLQSFLKPDWPLLLTCTGPWFTDHPVYHHLPFPHHWAFECVLKLCVHMCSVLCLNWVYMIWFVGRSLNFQPTLPSVAQLCL